MQEQVSESVCRVVLVVCEDTECVCERDTNTEMIYTCAKVKKCTSKEVWQIIVYLAVKNEYKIIIKEKKDYVCETERERVCDCVWVHDRKRNVTN